MLGRDEGFATVGAAHAPRSPVFRAVMRCILAVGLLIGLMIVMASLGSAANGTEDPVSNPMPADSEPADPSD